MNGEEREIKHNPNLKGGTVVPLDQGQKMDLLVWAGTPTCATVFQLLRNLCIEARDEAVAVDPADHAQQVALLTVAHAFAKMYTRFMNEVNSQVQDHLADVAEKAAAEEALSPEAVEHAVLESAINPTLRSGFSNLK